MKKYFNPSLFFSMAFGMTLLMSAPGVHAAESIPEEFKNVGIDEKLGKDVDLSLKFKNENGEIVTLGQYFSGNKPVVLLLAYYGCPNLCNFFLNGSTDALKKLKWTPGREFEVVTVSFDPQEDSELAKNKKASHIEALGKPEAAKGWHFLVVPETKAPDDTNNNAAALASQVGFKYRYDKASGEYAHAAAMIFLTPGGKVSRYLFGIDFQEKDLKLALSEASGNKIGNIVDRLLLFCYNYDPKTRKYSLYAMNLMRGAGILTVLAIGLSIARARRRSSKPSQDLLNEHLSERRP